MLFLPNFIMACLQKFKTGWKSTNIMSETKPANNAAITGALTYWPSAFTLLHFSSKEI